MDKNLPRRPSRVDDDQDDDHRGEDVGSNVAVHDRGRDSSVSDFRSAERRRTDVADQRLEFVPAVSVEQHQPVDPLDLEGPGNVLKDRQCGGGAKADGGDLVELLSVVPERDRRENDDPSPSLVGQRRDDNASITRWVAARLAPVPDIPRKELD